MANLTPPAKAPKRPDVILEMLRLAREEHQSAEHAMSYQIALARTHGLPWSDISHETGLSIPTCRRRAAAYIGDQEAAA